MRRLLIAVLLALPLGAEPAIPPTGCLFGVHPAAADMTTILDLESSIGRKFDADRQYYDWDAPIPTAYDTWTASQGRLPVISWLPRRDGLLLRWSNIALGREDLTIMQRADAFKAFEVPVVLIFHREPGHDVDNPRVDDPNGAGKATDFILAFRHIVSIFSERGATNVIWACVLKASDYDDGTVANLYPGDDVVDLIGADGYSPDFVTFEHLFTGLRNFGIFRSKPVFVAEVGCVDDPAIPERRAQWIADAATTIKNWPEMKLVCYFDAVSDHDWRIDTPAASLAAFTAMGKDPYFNVRNRAGKHRGVRH